MRNESRKDSNALSVPASAEGRRKTNRVFASCSVATEYSGDRTFRLSPLFPDTKIPEKSDPVNPVTQRSVS